MMNALRSAALAAALLVAACATTRNPSFDPNLANGVDNAPCPTADGKPCK